MAQANHMAADGINLACRCHLIPACQPESLAHVGQRLKPGTFGHDSYLAGGRDHCNMMGKGSRTFVGHLVRQAQPTPMLVLLCRARARNMNQPEDVDCHTMSYLRHVLRRATFQTQHQTSETTTDVESFLSPPCCWQVVRTTTEKTANVYYM